MKKKIMSLILSISMVLSLSGNLYAADFADDGTTTVIEEAEDMEEGSLPDEQETMVSDDSQSPTDEEKSSETEIQENFSDESDFSDMESAGSLEEENVEWGSWGTNINWLYDKTDKKLRLYGKGAMQKEGTYKFPWRSYSIESVEICDGITSVSINAFSGHKELKKISLPATVKTLGSGAFDRCEGLKEVILPEGMENIGALAFSECTNLQTIVIPDSVKTIDELAFRGCTSLESVTISSNTNEIALNSFIGTDNIKNIIFTGTGDAVVSFSYWTFITPVSIEVKEGVKRLTIDKGIKTSKLETLKLPESMIAFVGNFKDNNVLTGLNFRNTVSVSAEFENCSELSEVNLKNVIDINTGFENCASLKTLSLNTYDKNIGGGCKVSTLSGCPSLEAIIFGGTGKLQEWGSLENLTHELNIVIEDGVTEIGELAIQNSKVKTIIHIPTSIKKILSKAYEGCSNITDIYYDGSRKQFAEIARIQPGIRYHFLNEKLLSECTISVDPEIYLHTGEAICPLPVVKAGDTVLKNGIDYTLSYSNNIEIGTAAVTVTGCGDYYGEAVSYFKIIADNDIARAIDYNRKDETYEYTGKEIKPSVVLAFPTKDNPEGKLLSKDKDFTVSYENNIKTGKAQIVLKGIGDYIGEKRIDFRIIPPVVQNLEASSEERCVLHLEWEALPKDAADYCEVEYGLKEKPNDRQITKITEKEPGEENIEKLEADKIYVMRIRACKTVGNEIYKGAWSEEKEQKIKGNMTIKDCWGFANFGADIPASVYRKLFGAEQTRALLGEKDSEYSGGLCFGLAITAFASYYYGIPGLDMVGKESLSEVSRGDLDANKTLLQMIMFAHKLQDLDTIGQARVRSTDHLGSLYQAVKDYDDHIGEPVVIDLMARRTLSKMVGNHTVAALGIDEEKSNDTQTVIQLYDSAYPGVIRHLYLYKSKDPVISRYTSWKYGDFGDYKGKDWNASDYGEQPMDLLQFTTIGTDLFNALYQVGYMGVSGDDILLRVNLESDNASPEEVLRDFWERRNRPEDFTSIESTNGEDYADEINENGIMGWVKAGKSYTFSQVPAGTTLWMASSQHSLKIKVNEEVDITLKVTNTSEKSVQVTSEKDTDFTVTVYDRDKSSDTVEKTEINGTVKAGTGTSIDQSGTEFKVTGSGTIGMKSENGTEDDNWNLVNPEVRELPVSNLESGKTYVTSRKDDQMQLEEACKHKWQAWEVTAAPKVGKAGSRERTCSLCGTKEKSELPALGSEPGKFKISEIWWSIGSKKTVSADIRWNSYANASRYNICYGYVKDSGYSQEEISASEVRRYSVKESMRSDSSCRFWVEAYDKNGRLIGRSDEKYYTDTKITYNSRLTYNGKAQIPTVKVQVQGKTLKKGTDYTVSASGNTYPGKGKIKISLKGNYKGTITEELTIALRSSGLTGLTGGRKCFTAKWKKVSPGVTEYQIQYSTSKNFKKAKTVRVRNARTVRSKITGVKKGRYYVRIRTAGKIKGKVYYSGWSSARKVTVK